MEPVAQPATTKRCWPVLFCSFDGGAYRGTKEEEELRFQAKLLEAVGQSIIATDLEGKVLYWNRAQRNSTAGPRRRRWGAG